MWKILWQHFALAGHRVSFNMFEGSSGFANFLLREETITWLSRLARQSIQRDVTRKNGFPIDFAQRKESDNQLASLEYTEGQE